MMFRTARKRKAEGAVAIPHLKRGYYAPSPPPPPTTTTTTTHHTHATTHHAPKHTTPNPFRIPRQTRLAGGGYGNSATKQYATQRCQLPISRNTLSSVLGYQPNICVPSSASEM